MTQIELFPNNLSSREPLTLPHNPTYPTNIRSRFGSTTERATLRRSSPPSNGFFRFELLRNFDLHGPLDWCFHLGVVVDVLHMFVFFGPWLTCSRYPKLGV